jgi:hypothetical protein
MPSLAPRARRRGAVAGPWRVVTFGLVLALLTAAWQLEKAGPVAAPLNFYVQHGLTVRPVRAGDTIARGDAVTMTASSAQQVWLALWHDLGGTPRAIFAGNVGPGDDAPLAVPPIQTGSLPAQTFHALICSAAPETAAVHGPLPPGCAAETLTLRVR